MDSMQIVALHWLAVLTLRFFLLRAVEGAAAWRVMCCGPACFWTFNAWTDW